MQVHKNRCSPFQMAGEVTWLHGKKAEETIERLEKAVKELGTERNNDYWNATDGNAGYALNILLTWAKDHREAVWRVS
jgi:hypothetical protein